MHVRNSNLRYITCVIIINGNNKTCVLYVYIKVTFLIKTKLQLFFHIFTCKKNFNRKLTKKT